MSNWGILIPICAITAGPLAWAFNNWTRARHGFEPESYGRCRTDRKDGGIDAERRIALLTGENERLNGQIGRLEERLRVLERIATDPATRTAAEIEALRDR